MSEYFSYYIGYMDKEGKLFPFGPYNADGKLRPVICDSRSFASDIHERFYRVKEDMASKELKEEFSYRNYKDEVVFDTVGMYYCPIQELPDGDGIRHGYFLLEDIESYIRDGSTEGIFYDRLSPEVYAIRLQNELKFGPPKPKKDEEGYEYTEHSVADYGYFAYYDYHSEEADAKELKDAAYILKDDWQWEKEGKTPVVILQRG